MSVILRGTLEPKVSNSYIKPRDMKVSQIIFGSHLFTFKENHSNLLIFIWKMLSKVR